MSTCLGQKRGYIREEGNRMQKARLDLADRKNALQSMNNTALVGITIMNVILAIAYLLEVLKGARTIGSYLVVAALCIVPSIVSIILYLRKRDSDKVRYVSGICFAVLYVERAPNMRFSL